MKILLLVIAFLVPFSEFQHFSSGTDLRADISGLCRNLQESYFASRPPKKRNETEEEYSDSKDEELKAIWKEFSKLCRLHMPNLSHSLEWFQKYSLDGYSDPDDMMNVLGQIVFEIIQKLSRTRPKCRLALSTLATGVSSGLENWPIQMLDASGKPLSGILKGALHWTGDFYQCTNINMPIMPGNITEENPLIRGQYCTLQIAIPEHLKKSVVPVHMNKAFADKLHSSAIKWDFCSPQHCHAEDLKSILEPISDRANASFGIDLTKITCKKPVHPLRDNTAIGTLTLIGIIGIFLFTSTVNGWDLALYKINMQIKTTPNCLTLIGIIGIFLLIGTLYDILCCSRDSELDDDTFIISDGANIDLQQASHYNSAYEMDSASFDSSTNSISRNKDEEITENKPTDIILLSTRQTESYSIAESDTDTSNRKPAPVAPGLPLTPSHKEQPQQL